MGGEAKQGFSHELVSPSLTAARSAVVMRRARGDEDAGSDADAEEPQRQRRRAAGMGLGLLTSLLAVEGTFWLNQGVRR